MSKPSRHTLQSRLDAAAWREALARAAIDAAHHALESRDPDAVQRFLDAELAYQLARRLGHRDARAWSRDK